jgi:Tol biopolymer transport system component
VFYISGQSGTQSVWVVDLADGQPRQFSTMTALTVSDPVVSPDGGAVIFFSEGSAVILPVTGGEQARRIPLPASRLRWTPDSRSITYADGTNTNLWVRPIDGGAAHRLTTFADDRTIANFAWSPDGKHLAVARSSTTSDIVLLRGVK